MYGRAAVRVGGSVRSRREETPVSAADPPLLGAADEDPPEDVALPPDDEPAPDVDAAPPAAVSPELPLAPFSDDPLLFVPPRLSVL